MRSNPANILQKNDSFLLSISKILRNHSPVNIWSSSRLVSQAYNKDSSDGIHIGPFALDILFKIFRIILISKI